MPCTAAQEGAIHLAAAHVAPIHARQPVPQQGCVPLHTLQPGVCITTGDAEDQAAEELALAPLHEALAGVRASALCADQRLLEAQLRYQR